MGFIMIQSIDGNSSASDHRQKWFGVITLIVCIGILWGLLMPAVNTRTRESPRRTQCLNNIKNLALATINFEVAKKQYPGYQASFGKREDGSTKIGSWVVSLLPMLEQQALRDHWDDPTTHDAWLAAVRDQDKESLAAFYPTINVFSCPSDTLRQAEFAGMSYAANAGFQLLPNDPALGLKLYATVEDASKRSVISQRAANGLFANRLGPEVIDPQTGMPAKVFGYSEKRISNDHVRDGTSQTIMFAEHCNNLNWRDYSIADDSSRYQLGVVWLYAGKSASADRPQPLAVTDDMRINHHKLLPGSGPRRARPSGMHQGIVVAAFADGSTKVIDEGIDYQVYQSLMAPQDATSDIPNLNYELRKEDYVN